MLVKSIERVYTKFKLHFYKELFEKIQNRDTTLTTVETYCIEIIHALDRPTVGQFANFIHISSANAAYKINSLVKKGYLKKVQSKEDKREFFLEVTEKYMSYYNLSSTYVKTVSDRIEERFSEEDAAKLDNMLAVTESELMPEVTENIIGNNKK